MELKSFFRNVMGQTPRHADTICKVATLVKLIALVMRKADLTICMQQVDHIKAFIQELEMHPM